jgi:NTE family protein
MARSEVILCLQGGGALAAYQAGVIRALYEADLAPTLVVGVSTGALNGAVLVGHKRNDPDGALAAFWHELGRPRIPFMPDLGAALGAYGNPAMYLPRGNWLDLGRWNALYDTTPLARTLDKHVDTQRLADTELRPRLLLTATNLDTGEGEVFDSAVQPLTLEHVLASSALPPTFPPVEACDATGTRHTYWDGSLAGPPPLEAALERVEPDDVECAVVVDLFPRRGGVPRHMGDVGGRVLELVAADRNEGAARRLGGRCVFVRPDDPESTARAADFGRDAIRRRRDTGYAEARRALAARAG